MVHRVCVLGLMLTLLAGETAAQVVLSPTRYELDLSVDYEAEMLRGKARIDLENSLSEPARDASLLLYRLLRVQAVRDDQGRDLAFSQTVVAFEEFAKLQVNHVVIRLPEPLAPGARTTIQVQYEGHLLGYAETGMHYVQDRIDTAFTILRDDSFSYPELGYPSSAAMHVAPPQHFSYSARITVPKGLVVANGGRLEGADTLGDQVAFRFASLKPSWRMDFAIARYTLITAGTIQVYYLPGDSAGATGVAQAAEKALDLFSRWFGPLREEAALTFIEVPDGWGSQADATAVIQTAAAFRDPEQHRQVYHEISHLWSVSPTDRPSPRWNEGLASFLEFLVTQEFTGEPVVDPRATLLVNWLREELPGHPEWSKVPLVDYGRNGMTDLSYSVGALFFDLLYRLAGREAFNAIIGRYYADFGTGGGSTKDLAEVIRTTAKMDLSQLVADWLFTTAWAERVEQGGGIEELAAYYRGGNQNARKRP